MRVSLHDKTKPGSYMVRQGKYKPQPVRRKETPKPDGGGRKLGIPTVVDRIIQQTNAQQLTPIYEPLFSENSFPNPFRFKRKIREEIHAMQVKMHRPVCFHRCGCTFCGISGHFSLAESAYFCNLTLTQPRYGWIYRS